MTLNPLNFTFDYSPPHTDEQFIVTSSNLRSIVTSITRNIGYSEVSSYITSQF